VDTADIDTDSSWDVRPPDGRDVLVPGLTILSHPDLARIGERAVLAALASGRAALLSRLEPAFVPPSGGATRPLADAGLSPSAIRIEPGGARGAFVLDASGWPRALEVDAVPSGRRIEIEGSRVERGVTLVLAHRVAVLLHLVDPLAAGLSAGTDLSLVGASAAMSMLGREIERVAASDVPVLVRGETGTGKELVAQAIHRCSRRRRHPFVAVNLAAVPASLAAAELFGAARGAYTGADRARPGLFARANGGTLFLDEVGEASTEVQALLLRALESGEIQPVGGEPAHRVDVRVVAATDADLEASVTAGRFRAPLLHRLDGYSLRTPPLRERPDDVARLLAHFLDHEWRSLGVVGPPPWPCADAVARLATADWPGNVRQLRNVARRLALGGQPFPDAGIGRAPSLEPRVAHAPEVTDEVLLDTLRRHDFRVQSAARELRLPRTSVYERVARLTGRASPASLAAPEIDAALEESAGDLQAAARRLAVSLPALKRRLGQLRRHR
jgi:two-component system nitrogen regulation response regulator GlnG